MDDTNKVYEWKMNFFELLILSIIIIIVSINSAFFCGLRIGMEKASCDQVVVDDIGVDEVTR